MVGVVEKTIGLADFVAVDEIGRLRSQLLSAEISAFADNSASSRA